MSAAGGDRLAAAPAGGVEPPDRTALRRRRERLPALAAAAFGLALVAESILVVSGQWLAPRRWVALTAWPLWAVAAAAYLAVVRANGDDVDRRPDVAPEPAAPGRRPSPARWLRAVCAAIGLIGSAAAVALIQQTGDDLPSRNYRWILALWSASAAAYTLGLAVPGAWLRPGGLAAAARRHRVVLLDGALLFALALLLRLVLLGHVPNVLTGDEGVFGRAARWMAKGEGGHMFSTYWANGTLFLVPQALLADLLPAGRLATRLPTAVAGALAAPATYALGRVVATRRVGLVAGLLLAVSHLHVHVSRMGLGHGYDALWAAVAGAALLHAVRRRDMRTAAVAGLALGLAQYGYVAGRLVDAVALAFAALTAAGLAIRFGRRRGGRRPVDPAAGGAEEGAPLDTAGRGGWRAWWAALGGGPLLAAAGGALVVAAPMIRWALVRPNDYFSRLSAQGILQTGKWQEVAERVGDGRAAIALSQARDALYAIVAAPSYEFYFTPYPMLDVVWTGLLGLGFVACATRITDRGRLWLVLQIALSWLTLALGAHASTASYRITGALPAMAVVAAIALFALSDALWAPAAADAGEDGAGGDGADDDVGDRHRVGKGSTGGGPHWTTAAGLVVGIVSFQLWAYWGVFAPGCGFFDRSTATASLLGERVQADGEGRAVFVLGRQWFDAGVFESVPYLSDRTVDIYDGVAPEGTRADADPLIRTARIFDVPEGADLDVLAERVRAASPALLFAVPERRSELDFLSKRLGGGPVDDLARCAKTEGTLLVVTRIGGGAAP
ncbi:MAG: glycosyltransferase family 39 protein [Anaerolineae bacterium]